MEIHHFPNFDEINGSYISRYAEFEKNADLVDDHNSRYSNGSETYSMDTNHLSDLVTF